MTLTSKGYASFAYATSDGPVASGSTCLTPARIEVTPPNAFDHLVIPEKMPDCGPNVQVSAVTAGILTNYAQALE